MKASIFILPLALALSLSSCSKVLNHHVEYELVKPEKFPVLTAVGYAPVSLQPGENQEQKVLNAIRASKLDAYRELAEQVYGVQLQSNTSFGDLVISDDGLQASISGVIRGAKVVQSYPVGDMYATELELDFKNVFYLYQSQAMPRKVKKVHYY